MEWLWWPFWLPASSSDGGAPPRAWTDGETERASGRVRDFGGKLVETNKNNQEIKSIQARTRAGMTGMMIIGL